MAEKAFPMIKEKNQGKFTNWAKKNMPGKSTCRCCFFCNEKQK